MFLAEYSCLLLHTHTLTVLTAIFPDEPWLGTLVYFCIYLIFFSIVHCMEWNGMECEMN